MAFDFSWYKHFFDAYAAKYDQHDGRVALKILQTYSVTAIMERLCIMRRVPAHTKELAMLCALFHDIGRFEQLRQYDTFLDHLSCNHAEMSCQILREEAILSALSAKDQDMVLTAVRSHNQYEIDPALSENPNAGETLELCRLIRDADKCDIFRVFACEAMTDVVGASEETIAAETITPAVLQAFFAHKSVDKKIRKTYLDYWVGFLAFFFDFNYPESIKISCEQGYYRMPFDRTRFVHKETREQIDKMFKELENYMENRLAESDLNEKETIPASLKTFFQNHRRIALAFSGGTDSAYLLYAASRCGTEMQAYYVSTPFQPQFELEDARRLADMLQVPMKVLPFDVLSVPEVQKNPSDRCYYCKNVIFRSILEAAEADGFTEIMDGTNASDDAGDRPGMRALKELHVLSPLRECGVTKARLRELSRNAGLFTWDKPAYACLATRVPANVPITADILKKTEQAEALLSSMGFTDFRVRVMPEYPSSGDSSPARWAARLQITEPQLPLFLSVRSQIHDRLKENFSAVLLDLNLRTPSF